MFSDMVRCLHISEHEPRKGTETEKLEECFAHSFNLFQNTNPERGRKPANFSSNFFWYPKFQNTNPERGRKRMQIIPYYAHPHDFRTRTPKGDGNKRSLPAKPLSPRISEHEPRKGTETGVAGRESVRLHDHFRTRTPKGDGNFFGGCANSLFRVFISERESRKRMEQAMISY